MASINVVVISGRFAEKPELQEYNDGAVQVVHARVMTSYSKRNSDFDESQEPSDTNQQWIEVPEGHDVEIWNQQARFVSQYAVKGQQVTVKGRLKVDSYDDQNFKNDAGELCRRRRVVITADPMGVILGAEPRGGSSNQSSQPAPSTPAGDSSQQKPKIPF